MPSHHLRFDAPLPAYELQAQQLIDGHRARDVAALELIRKLDPRLRTPGTRWLPLSVSREEVAQMSFELQDARESVALGYSFEAWSALEEFVAAMGSRGAAFVFESAVEAVIDGDLAALGSLLRSDPALVRARSTRRCCFDPPLHGATTHRRRSKRAAC